MFRTICFSCSSVVLLIVATGAAYQQQCQYDTVVCPTVGSSACYAPDTSISPLCSPLPSQNPCNHTFRSNQSLCQLQPYRTQPANYLKCYKAASSGKIKQEVKDCYQEVQCVWNAATGTCEGDFDNMLFCFMTEWVFDNSQPLCQESPPL